LAVAVSIWVGIYLYREEFFVFKKAEKYFYFFASVAMVIYLHLLSVRSGLLGFYLSAAYFILYFAFIKKKWKHALVALLATVMICSIAFIVSPTIKMKLGYMKFDLKEYMHGNINGRSDAGRLMSQKISWDVVQKNIFIGVGMGDVEDEVKKEYQVQHPEIEQSQRFEPHNEFLFIAVGIGILGLILFFTPIFSLFFVSNNYRKWLLGCGYIILLSSFFTEATLEMQIGVALFLFVILMMHYQFKTLSEL
jgi:O-antigen ligase